MHVINATLVIHVMHVIYAMHVLYYMHAVQVVCAATLPDVRRRLRVWRCVCRCADWQGTIGLFMCAIMDLTRGSWGGAACIILYACLGQSQGPASWGQIRAVHYMTCMFSNDDDIKSQQGAVEAGRAVTVFTCAFRTIFIECADTVCTRRSVDSTKKQPTYHQTLTHMA